MGNQERINANPSNGYGSLESKDVETGSKISQNGISNEAEPKAVDSKLSVYITNALYAVCFVVLLFLSTSSFNFSGAGRKMSNNVTISVHLPFHETITDVPFDHIDRSDYNVPANQVINPALFHPSLRNDVECDGNYENCTPKDDRQGKSLLKVPIPTGAFWTNMIVPHVTGDGYSFPIVAYPYGFEWGDDTLAMSYSSLRRIMDDLTIRDIFNPDVKFKAEEPIQSRYVTKFDPLSVTLRFNGKSAPGSNGVAGSIASSPYWETYLVQGSPWMTARYEGMTPVIHALSTFMGVDCPQVSDCQVVYVPWQVSRMFLNLNST